MKKFFNPFTYIAGAKSLLWGLIGIVGLSVVLYFGDMTMNGFIHFTFKEPTTQIWQVALLTLIYWIMPAAILNLCGIMLSRSQVRSLDIFGTTSFAYLALIPISIPMLVPAVAKPIKDIALLLDDTITADSLPLPILVIYGIWCVAWIALYFVWLYNAYKVSCNIRGWKSVASFFVMLLVMSMIAPYIYKIIA